MPAWLPAERVRDANVKVTAAHATTADKTFRPHQSPGRRGRRVLDPDVAFVLTADAQSTNKILLNWRIADGYYLYKQRIKLEPADTARPCARGPAQGRGRHRRILRHAGDLSAESRRFVLGAAGRQECRCQSDLPGLRRCRPVLSADHQTDDDLARGCADLRGQSPTVGSSTGGFVSEQDSYADKIKNGNISCVSRVVLRCGIAAGVHPLRVAHGSHSLGDHRRRRRESFPRAARSCSP